MNTFALLLALAPAPQFAPAAQVAPAAPLGPVAAVAPVAPVAAVAPVPTWGPASGAAVPVWRYASTSAQDLPGDVQSAEAALVEAERRLEAARRRLAELQREESRAARPAAPAAPAAGGAGPNSTSRTRDFLWAERGAVAQRRAMEHDIHTELRRALEAAQGGPVPREELERLLQGSRSEARGLAVAAQRAAEGEAARAGGSGSSSTKVWIDGRELEVDGDAVVRLQNGQPLVLRAKDVHIPRGESPFEHLRSLGYLGESSKAAGGGNPGAETMLRLLPRSGAQGQSRVARAPSKLATVNVDEVEFEELEIDEVPMESVIVETEVVDGAKKSLVFRVRTENSEELADVTNGDEHELEVFLSPKGGTAAGSPRAVRAAVPATPSAPPSAPPSLDTSDETIARVLESLSSELAALRRDLNDLRSRVEQR